MKIRRFQAGMTLIEMLVTLVVVGVGAGTYFLVLSSATTLGAKNDAVNQSHYEARRMMNHAVSDIRRSVSAPFLVDANFNQLSLPADGTAVSAAGVVYQVLACGPGKVTSLSTAGSTSIQVTFYSPYDPVAVPSATQQSYPAPAPQVGMRLLIPSAASYPPDYGEYNITGVSGSWTGYPQTTSANFTLTLGHGLDTSIDGTASNSNLQVYCTLRTALMSNGVSATTPYGTLRYYPNIGASTTAYTTLLPNIMTAAPFSMNIKNPQTLYVAFMAGEQKATRRGYTNVNFQTSLNSSSTPIPAILPVRTVLAHMF